MMSDDRRDRTCPACGGDGWIDGAREVLGRETTECPFCADVEEVERDFESDYAVSALFGPDAQRSIAESCVEKRGEHPRCEHRRKPR